CAKGASSSSYWYFDLW
nr:immunoglobulin heavy chain junction region [Macaca mulatta]MOV90553.1 immunoglobulin heavy chain junction region [Macaca mulatta]MOV90658.1 immunoglobulin heavy chain junction region [Macaca mulatta]